MPCQAGSISGRCLLFALGLCLGASALPAQERLALDWPAIADKVVERMALEEGEKVLLVAHPEMFRSLIPYLRSEVLRAGAVDLGVIDVLAKTTLPPWDPVALKQAKEPARAVYRRMFREVDAAIILPGARGTAYNAMQDLLREGHGRTVHFHWLETTSAYPLPGQPLPVPHVVDATYQKALLETDYAALARLQQRFERALRDGEVHVTSPLGTDLRFRIGERPVCRQDGDASAARARAGRILIDREIELPAGAVRVAPLEESVNGTVAFPPSQWDGRPVTGLRLGFEAGRIVRVEADSGQEFAAAEIKKAGDAGESFREFALGFNPHLAVPEPKPWIPYYGYGAGVVRLSLGDNSELGGKVGGGYFRWNFFIDTTVTVGDETWVRDGKLVVHEP